jgi:hypothetical protein
MGEVINKKIFSDKIRYKIELTEMEAVQLKNHVKKIHLFSGDLCAHHAKTIERGAKKGAKYFVIPMNLKSRKKKNYPMVSYQKIETDRKTFFVCIANKSFHV